MNLEVGFGFGVCGRCVKMASHPAFPSEPNPIKTEFHKLILRLMKLQFSTSYELMKISLYRFYGKHKQLR